VGFVRDVPGSRSRSVSVFSGFLIPGLVLGSRVSGFLNPGTTIKYTLDKMEFFLKKCYQNGRYLAQNVQFFKISLAHYSIFKNFARLRLAFFIYLVLLNVPTVCLINYSTFVIYNLYVHNLFHFVYQYANLMEHSNFPSKNTIRKKVMKLHYFQTWV